jgi:SAM-dependent methyltransferase
MHDDLRFAEDLRQLAVESFDLAGRLCGSCRNMHAVWPYIRLSRASTGVETGISGLEQLIAELVGGGRRRVLIGGARDTGILALVARAGADRGADIVVLDVCTTPLELCRRYAQRWSLHVETLREDLADFGRERDFDVVIIHGTLSYIPENERAEALRRIARSLRQNGRLVLLFNTSERIRGTLASQHHAGYPEWVIGELHRLHVPLPESADAFTARLKADAQASEAREGTFTALEQVDALLDSAGFVVETRRQIDVDLVGPIKHYVSRISKRRYLAVASLKPDSSDTRERVQ